MLQAVDLNGNGHAHVSAYEQMRLADEEAMIASH